MNNNNFIQVFEHQKLKVDGKDFLVSHLESLVKFNEKNGNKYFIPIYNGIQFKSYVGVIQVDNLTIEILPKADNGNSDSNEHKSLWQGVLLKMLKECRYINVDTISESTLKKRNNSILEVYYDIFLTEIERLIKNGLIKKYRRIEQNQLSLKGKLLFSKNLQKNIVHKQNFYCEHQVYDRDHTIHQILFQAIRILDNLVSYKLQNRVNRCLSEFDNFKIDMFSELHFDKINIDRKTEPYKNSLEIAKMFILNYSPALNRGQESMLTLLFDMNKLWEEFIYRILQKNLDSNKYEISSQERDKFWEDKIIRPDIVIRNTQDEEIYIIDTKWKILDSNIPDDDDLKQIFTYNLHWKSSKALLLYPKISQKDSPFGHYHHRPYHLIKETINQVENRCKVGFISVVENSSLKNYGDLHLEIMNKFISA